MTHAESTTQCASATLPIVTHHTITATRHITVANPKLCLVGVDPIFRRRPIGIQQAERAFLAIVDPGYDGL